MKNSNKKILITGDIANDYYFISGDREYFDSKQESGTSISRQKGGSYLIYQILENLKNITKEKGISDLETIDFAIEDVVFDNLPDKNNSYAIVSKFKSGALAVWKVDKTYGFGSYIRNYKYPVAKPAHSENKPNMIIIDDAGMDFGSFINKEAWPLELQIDKHKKASASLVIYKMSGKPGQSELWKSLKTYSKDILITIVSINDLRKNEVKISSGISWEQTALDLVYELKNNVHIRELLNSKYLIITFQTEGAVFVINHGKGNFEYNLIFDPFHLEGEWTNAHEGSVIGQMSCFTAALAAKLNFKATPGKHFELLNAIKAGLSSVRQFCLSGYERTSFGIELPYQEINEVILENEYKYSSAFIPSPQDSQEFLKNKWTIILNNYKTSEHSFDYERYSIFDLARNVVMKGKKVLENIPSGSFGNLFTVDRSEIESLRNLKKLMENYVSFDKGKKPLSIAVFGPPGSGKSFAVKEIARGVMGTRVPILEFNLSQFGGTEDLIGAFHQVRDEAIKGSIPVVFWDEFDSQEYRWLQYLLAPMQDGAIQEGQVTHPIGKCIFVFAGGTSKTMETFGPAKNEEQKLKEFQLKKGPDFISRLHGFLNVLGPNKRQIFNKPDGIWEDDETDLFYPIRRALFIRAMMGLYGNEFLDLDWGLMNALLKVDTYKNGARSLEQLLTQLKRNSKGTKILRSHLPANNMLELFVEPLESDPEENSTGFLTCLIEDMEFLKKAYKLAPAIHGVWLSLAKAKNPEYTVGYRFLPVFVKSSNLAAAKRIPRVLSEAKLKIIGENEPGTLNGDEYKDHLSANNNMYLEKMAEKEHELWMLFYTEYEWQYGKQRNDYERIHPCLVSYNDKRLSEDDRDKDRNQVKMYFDILSLIGFGIAKE